MTDNKDLTPQNTAFADQLRALAATITPDPAFAEALSMRLHDQREAKHMNRKTIIMWTKRLLTTAAALVLITTAVLTIPSLRAFAQQVIDALIQNDDDDTFLVEYAGVDVDALPRTDSLVEVDALEDVLQMDVLIPADLPEDYTFVEALYQPEGRFISQSYRTRAGVYLIVYQYRAEGVEPDNVGASAEIVDVPLEGVFGDVTGQYVQGAWVIDIAPHEPTFAPGQAVSETGRWDSDIPMRRLRWQADDIIYEIAVNRGQRVRDLLTMDQLVEIAESLR